jgi:hypothetical protein
MRRRFLPAALAAALIAVPATMLPAQRGGVPGRGGELRTYGPDRRDWTDTADRTQEGGFRMGNPNARVKIVEYVSLTCEHCAAFAAHGLRELLQNYVQHGQVSLEFRNYYRDGVDIAAAMLSRCAEPRPYFDFTYALFAQQRQWMGRIAAITPAQRQEIATLPPLAVAGRIVPLLGLDAIGAHYGVTPERRQVCFNQAALDQLQAMHDAAVAQGVAGTPVFFINGVRQEASEWTALEPLIRAAEAH